MWNILLRCSVCLLLLLMPIQAMAGNIGVLMPAKNIPYYTAAHDAMQKELAGQGDILLQNPAPNAMAWTNAARKLVTLESKVIVTYGAAATQAVLAENNTVPVVFCGAFDPEAAGLLGKNATGISSKVPIQGLVKNLKSIANFKKLGIVFSSEEKDSGQQAEAAAALAGQLGFEAVKQDIKGAGDDIKLPAAEAVLLTTASPAMIKENLKKIVEQARAGKVATAALLCGCAEEGVLITLAANPEHQGQEAGKMVASLLKGGAPSSVPVNNSPKIELTINLVEAKALGLAIPFELLGSAKVIK